MKENIKISPVGLKGHEINDRMKELMGIKTINENKSTSVVELTKKGPDGNYYAIVRENHEYFIKTTAKKDNLLSEDFKYIGGLMNKKSEAYPSYAKAIKHLNLKFNSLAEAFNVSENINVFENDNLLNSDNEEKEIEESVEEETDVELSEEEKEIEDMIEEESLTKVATTKKGKEVTENKLSISKAMKDMDAIIDGLGKVKKKVYTIS